jgi:hypothetical protein
MMPKVYFSRSKEIDQNKQINLISSVSKMFFYQGSLFYDLLRYLHKYIFHIKIQLFAMAKSDQDPEVYPHRGKKLHPGSDPH